MSNYTQERNAAMNESRTRLRSNVPGWGADLDPKNRPAVPKEKPSDVQTPYGTRPPQQQIADVKIHQSTEHAHITPVFGTTCPPTA